MHVALLVFFSFVFFFKQKTAYEMRISDWSSDVCSSDLRMLVYPGNPHVHYADFQALGAHRNMATDLSPESSFAEQMTVQTFASTHAPGRVVQSRYADAKCRRAFKNHHGSNHHQSEPIGRANDCTPSTHPTPEIRLTFENTNKI